MRPLLMIASFALTFSPALAVATPPPMTDVVLARSALAAIDADAGVRGVNLIVSVVDRVAVIGGPVPSAEVGKRAEAVVRSISGITEVRNNCFVQEKPDPLVKAVADRLAAGPLPLVAELPAVVPQSRPAATTEAPARPTDAGFAALTAPPPVLPLAAPVAAADKVVVASRPPILSTDPTDGFLGTPGSGRSAAVLTGGSVPLTPPAKAAFPARPTDALASADAIRKADARFGALTAEMRDGTLVVGGKADRLSDAWDFAQSLRRVPGVARVVVGGVGVK
jgi:hypothetical protein